MIYEKFYNLGQPPTHWREKNPYSLSLSIGGINVRRAEFPNKLSENFSPCFVIGLYDPTEKNVFTLHAYQGFGVSAPRDLLKEALSDIKQEVLEPLRLKVLATGNSTDLRPYRYEVDAVIKAEHMASRKRIEEVLSVEFPNVSISWLPRNCCGHLVVSTTDGIFILEISKKCKILTVKYF